MKKNKLNKKSGLKDINDDSHSCPKGHQITFGCCVTNFVDFLGCSHIAVMIVIQCPKGNQTFLLFCFVGLLFLVRVPAPNVLLLPIRPLVVVKTHAKPHPRHRPSLEVRMLLLLLLARPRWGIGPGSRRCGIPVAATPSTTTSSRDD